MAALSSLFSLSLLYLFLAAQAFNNQDPKCSATNDHSSDLKIFHVYSPCSPFRPPKQVSWEEDVLQTQAKDKARLLFLASLAGTRKSFVPIASGRQITQNPTYIVKALIGSPPQTLLMAVDTSSDAAWVPCNGCIGCSSTVFNSLKSTSFKSLGCQAAQCKQVPNPTCLGSTCSFNLTYGGSTIASNLSQDTFTLASDNVTSYTFGCIQKTTGSSVPPQGLLGLGRGPLSLLSQTQNLYKSTFSYCLPSYKSPNFSGTLRLGTAGQPIKIKYTPLLMNPKRPSLYFVNLMAIRVGRRIVDIPPAALAFNPNTGAGTVFDSGTTFSRLITPAYEAVRNEFRRRVGRKLPVTSLGGFDTCYSVPIVVPTITFMFSGMNVTLPTDNIVIRSSAGSTTCLAMSASPALNVIANMQQQNHRVLIDVPNSRLGVSREVCT